MGGKWEGSGREVGEKWEREETEITEVGKGVGRGALGTHMRAPKTPTENEVGKGVGSGAGMSKTPKSGTHMRAPKTPAENGKPYE